MNSDVGRLGWLKMNEPHKRDAIATNGTCRGVVPCCLLGPVYNKYLMRTLDLLWCCDDVQARTESRACASMRIGIGEKLCRTMKTVSIFAT